MPQAECAESRACRELSRPRAEHAECCTHRRLDRLRAAHRVPTIDHTVHTIKYRAYSIEHKAHITEHRVGRGWGSCRCCVYTAGGGGITARVPPGDKVRHDKLEQAELAYVQPGYMCPV
jgi:hypothetical protein